MADRIALEILRMTPLPQARKSAAGAEPSAAPLVLSTATLLAGRALQPGLQAPVALGTAIPLLGEAVDDFLAKGVTSHVLEALAVVISVGRKDYLAAHITSFLLALGEYLEASIERRSDDMLKHLLKPDVNEIWVERAGREIQLDAAELKVGDTVIAATGWVIPVDGTVLGGEAMVNEATMTGESVPVARRRGDAVLSGTLVEEERVAAVLQADYSCALKLATPVAFKASMYEAGKSGMLVKGAKALERLAEADTFVFDKTGTLSTGKLEVTDSIVFKQGYSAEDLINLAASVEEHYFHPLALAVVEASRRLDRPRHFDHKEVEFIVAHGVASVIGGRRIVVGSRHFIEDDERIPVHPHDAVIEGLQRAGKTLLYIGFGGELLGVIALRDGLRSNSAATVKRLRRLGVKRVLMLTGDHPARARGMAAELGLDAFHAGLMPADKARILEELAAQGARIAFIGDGVNDAPALSSAHVGISMHHGADIARLAADVALLEDDIARVADAKALALATERLIGSNFRLTVGLNTTILSAAALGWLRPVAASVLHNGSTIAILLRALLGVGLPRVRRTAGSVADKVGPAA